MTLIAETAGKRLEREYKLSRLYELLNQAVIRSYKSNENV